MRDYLWLAATWRSRRRCRRSMVRRYIPPESHTIAIREQNEARRAAMAIDEVYRRAEEEVRRRAR
jgi:hypothetical protein